LFIFLTFALTQAQYAAPMAQQQPLREPPFPMMPGMNPFMMAGMDNGGPRITGMNDKHHPTVGDPPDIETFLDDNKDRIDADPEANPYDDLRHYAYEGDGNSGGSLSSLNSGEDDADLEFEYLHNFGPRFKKLADMYGRESDSDSEPDDGHDNPAYFPKPPVPGSESWC